MRKFFTTSTFNCDAIIRSMYWNVFFNNMLIMTNTQMNNRAVVGPLSRKTLKK